MNNTILLIPAFNEAECLEKLLRETEQETSGMDVLVISDGSTDETALLARRLGCRVLDLPCNLGVGGAVQAGLRYALDNGYRFAARCDADGQHRPAEIESLLNAVRDGPIDVAIGSRFLGRGQKPQTLIRNIGVRSLARILSVMCRTRITDPTSGFQAFNIPAMKFFARCYPSDYPEPEALAMLSRYGYSFREIGVRFRERQAGTSSLEGGWNAIFYAFKVFLSLCVDRARKIDPDLARANINRKPSTTEA